MWKTNRLVVISMSVLLTACFGGGGSSSSGGDGRTVKAHLIDAPVAGVEYINVAGDRDITLADGGFYCEVGETVQFFVGGINLGSVACAENAKVYPMDLLPEAGVTKGTFDSSSLAARAALLLLTINNEKPESYDINNRGPDSLSVAMMYRTLLDGYT